jgi:hypothetical protein
MYASGRTEPTERGELKALLSGTKHAARKLKRAQILGRWAPPSCRADGGSEKSAVPRWEVTAFTTSEARIDTVVPTGAGS